MKALHFGAGNIGRGFIGKLSADSNIEVIFADVNESVVNLLKTHRTYGVKIVGDSLNTVEQVNKVSAVNSTDEAAIIALFNEVDLVTTAVGPNVLKIIANTLAKALEARLARGNSKPLNIIACEIWCVERLS